MKRIVLSVLAAIMALSLCSCAEKDTPASSTVEEKLTVPDIVGTEEDIAKTILASNGLIPTVEKAYDDKVEFGKVIRTSPSVGSPVEKNGKVTLYISNGPKYLKPSSSNMRFYSITKEKMDDWNFNNPYIEEGVLYIQCQPMFMANIKWVNYREDLGGSPARASISDTFEKTVPVNVLTSQESLKAGERGDITLKIPLSDLDVQKPTTMYLQLFAYVNGEEEYQTTINISFVFSW